MQLAAAWLCALELIGAVLLGLAALVELAARRASAATRRGVWVLALAIAVVLPLTRLAIDTPRFELAPAGAWAISSVWLVGVLALLARLVHAGLLARRRVSASRSLAGPWSESLAELQDGHGRPEVALRVSDTVSGPLTIGVLRPVILVPSQLLDASAAERRAVLAHELAHVGRADCLWLITGALVRAIYWVNPLAWWALRRLREQAESAADDAVLDAGVASSSYAAQLVRLARVQLERAGRVAATGLRERVEAILDVERPRSRALAYVPGWSVARLIGAAVLLASLVTACEARSDAGDPPRPSAVARAAGQ